MSRESRTVRPFVGLSKLSNVLSESLLHFGQSVCPADTSVHMDIQPHEFLLRPIQLEWASDDSAYDRFRSTLIDGAEESELNPRDLDVVVVASSRYLKLAEVVMCESVVAFDQIPRVLDLTGEPRFRAFSTPNSGFSLDAYIVLSRTLEQRPLQPYRKATWLARASFRVDTSLSVAILPPTPLTSEKRRELKLPPKTMRYVDFGEHDFLLPYSEQEQPTLYVDENLLAQLNVRRGSAVSKAIQVQLVHDLISAVVWRASRLSDLNSVSYADVQSSLLGSVIRVAAGAGSTEEARTLLLKKVREAPEYVISSAEHAIDLMARYLDAVKDGES
jgi:hypothetical protein